MKIKESTPVNINEIGEKLPLLEIDITLQLEDDRYNKDKKICKMVLSFGVERVMQETLFKHTKDEKYLNCHYIKECFDSSIYHITRVIEHEIVPIFMEVPALTALFEDRKIFGYSIFMTQEDDNGFFTASYTNGDFLKGIEKAYDVEEIQEKIRAVNDTLSAGLNELLNNSYDDMNKSNEFKDHIKKGGVQ